MTTDTGMELAVMILAPIGRDAMLIAETLQRSGVTAQIVNSVAAAIDKIKASVGVALIADEALDPNSIRDLSQALAAQPAWSDLPVVIMTGNGGSNHATDQLVAMRAPLGHVTLVERPVRPVTLLSMVQSMLQARRRQYEIRDHISEQAQMRHALMQSHQRLELEVERRTKALRTLSARLLHTQDDERRRLARELHDSLGQYLAALSINLDLIQSNSPEVIHQLAEARETLQQCIQETRTLSYLLHPPLLDEMGLESALRWYVEGFGQRSGIQVKLSLQPMTRMPSAIETMFFRVIQETLTNIHRHSGSRTAEVRLHTEEGIAKLEVQDHGVGMAREFLARFQASGVGGGVGMAGMRERVNELGGQLNIVSDGNGTLVTVTLPAAKIA
jgi:signal transduction histidine kinase